MNQKNISEVKQMLAQSWDITDRKSFYSNLEWLYKEGHRSEFNEIAQGLKSGVSENDLAWKYGDKKVLVVKEYYKELGSKSILGWDYARYVFLCRCVYSVGYISEDEAWKLIMPVAKNMQKTFDSWDDLAKNYMIGREFWDYHQAKSEENDLTWAFTRLSADPQSPWNVYSWDMDLN